MLIHSRTTLLTLLFFVVSTLHAIPDFDRPPQNHHISFTTEKTPLAGHALDLLLSLLAWPLTVSTVAHEYGHAFAAKFLQNAPLKVFLGADKGAYLASCKGLTLRSFKFFGLAPEGVGAAIVPATTNKHHRLLVTAAGPVAGIAMLLVIKMMINKYSLVSPVATFVYTTLINAAIVGQALYGFTPLGGFLERPEDGDGYQICKDLGVDQSHLDTLSQIDAPNILFTCTLLKALWGYSTKYA